MYYDEDLAFSQIKGMRDRIVHSYGDIDSNIVKEVMKNDIPLLYRYIEENVHPMIINNPYELYEIEYDDFIKKEEAKGPAFIMENLPETNLIEKMQLSKEKRLEQELQK